MATAGTISAFLSTPIVNEVESARPGQSAWSALANSAFSLTVAVDGST